ncbi:MAG: polyprenyl synthetase family protein, partial [Oscillospiraceae bacterium]|nr:polyprenyl synthetase family protein [Oscillospiraceae bacterium]
ELQEIDSRKTGALLTAACLMGVAAAGGSPEQEEAAARFGAALGFAFQIRDDMLDVLSTEQELGKPIGSDQEEKKHTYMALYGEQRCAEMVQKLTDAAKSALEGAFADTAYLCALADGLTVRRN